MELRREGRITEEEYRVAKATGEAAEAECIDPEAANPGCFDADLRRRAANVAVATVLSADVWPLRRR